MNRTLLLTLVTAGVAAAVIRSRRRGAESVAPMGAGRWRSEPDDYFDGDALDTRNAGGSLDVEDDEDDIDIHAEALGLVQAIDEQEIAAAEQALARPELDPSIRAYADRLLSDHSENLAAGQALDIDPETTAEASDLAVRRAQRLRVIEHLEGDEYTEAFLDAMVDLHQEALGMVDRLLPETYDEDVRDYLAGTRAHLASHLQRTRELLAQR